MIAGVRRAIIGPHHQINYGASKAENGVPEVQTARSNGQGSRLGAHHVQKPKASPVSRSTPNCATAQRPVLPASWASSTTSNGPPQHRRPERADLPAATHTATTAGPGPPKHPSKHLHLTPQVGGYIDCEKCGTSALVIRVAALNSESEPIVLRTPVVSSWRCGRFECAPALEAAQRWVAGHSGFPGGSIFRSPGRGGGAGG